MVVRTSCRRTLRGAAWCLGLSVAVVTAGSAPAVAAPAVRDFPLPTAGAKPTAIVAGPDGALWFTERGSNRLGRITTAGAVQEIPLQAPGLSSEVRNVDGIEAGPDGALWFTQDLGAVLGRIDSRTRAVTYREVPQIGALTVAADGQPWFAGVRDGLHRLDGTGVFSIDPDGSGGSLRCTALTRGAGPTIWCGEGLAVRRLDLSTGRMRQSSVGGSSLEHVQQFVRSTRDGAVWFSRYLSGKGTTASIHGSIGRMTDAGKVRQWPLPERAAPFDVAVGPDGRGWALLEDATLVSVTPSGRMSIVQLPGRRSLDDMTFGPDGAIWAVDFAGNRIVRIRPGGFPSVRSRSLRHARGTIATRVRCPSGGTCRGTLVVRRKTADRGTVTIASRAYRVRSGRTATIKARSSSRGRSIIARSRSQRVAVELRLHGGGVAATELTLRR